MPLVRKCFKRRVKLRRLWYETKFIFRCKGLPVWFLSKSEQKYRNSKNVYLPFSYSCFTIFFLLSKQDIKINKVSIFQVFKKWNDLKRLYHLSKNCFLLALEAITVLNYPATDFVCWPRILYVKKSVACGCLPINGFPL